MSRHFTTLTVDHVDLAPGAVANVDGGPMTIVCLWRPTSVHEGWLIDAENGAGGHAYTINTYTDGFLWHTMVGFRQTMAYTAADGWRLDLWSKPAGSAPVRGHHLLLSGGGWVHADYTASTDSTNIPITHIRVGQHFTSGGTLNGDVAALGVVGADWSDAGIAAAGLETGLAAWLAMAGVSPTVVWAFNQTSVSDPVLDVTGGGGDQLAVSGTTVGADPPGFSYLLAPPTDCVLSGVLPALDSAVVGQCSASVVLAAMLPAGDAHLMVGGSLLPPLMVGSAVVRELLGSAMVV